MCAHLRLTYDALSLFCALVHARYILRTCARVRQRGVRRAACGVCGVCGLCGNAACGSSVQLQIHGAPMSGSAL